MTDRRPMPLFIDIEDAKRNRKRNGTRTPDYKYSKKKDLNRKRHNKKKTSPGNVKGKKVRFGYKGDVH
jgi:hypothetical protein